MSINFIPNDPRASAPAMRTQDKRANRPAARSGFTFNGTNPEGVFAPDTPGFLFWQCREAALAALQAWEASAGPHAKWQGNRKKLALLHDEGVDLNAFYDRASFSFFHQAVNGSTLFSGKSTDVVAHEIGHGLLDSLRPDLFDVNFLEAGAFHEAFGDCVAILTALNDKETRQKLLASTSTLRKRNFVETTAEQLSEGISFLFPGHNAGEARRAFNTFQFQLPQTLPSDGGPGELINEVHSFGMVFTGCFWDLLANLFNASKSKTEATLLSACQLAGRLLVGGTKAAVITPRFLQSVGRAMVLADQALHAGANRDHLRDAFQRHNILLGSNALLAPTMALAGTAPKRATLSPATRKDLHERLGIKKGTRLNVKSTDLFGTRVVSAAPIQEVSLSGVHPRLAGVVATAEVPVLVGTSGARAAVVGTLPNPGDTENEVRSFVETLVKHGQIDFGKKKGSVAMVARPDAKTTHEIKVVKGKKELHRVRFV